MKCNNMMNQQTEMMGNYNSNQMMNNNMMMNQLMQMMGNYNFNPMMNNNMINQINSYNNSDMNYQMSNNSTSSINTNYEMNCQIFNNMMMNFLNNQKNNNNIGMNEMVNPFFNNNFDETLNSLLDKKFKNLEGKKLEEISFEDRLIQFLSFICLDESKIQKYDYKNYKDKIIINYYNLINIDVYLDLNLKVEELIKNIFWHLFYPSSIKYVNKRTNQYQTTEFIINNPISEPNYDCGINYQDILYLEYKEKNLSEFKGKTGKEIGIKDKDGILLKLNKDFYNKIKENLNKELKINIDNNQKKFFWFEENEKASERIIKIFNKDKYDLVSDGNKVLEKSNLINLNDIKVSTYSNLIGRGGNFTPISFIDVSKGEVKELKFSRNAPKWRLVNEGLNIFGICKNKKCEANKKEVVYRTNLSEKGLTFILNEELSNIECPICHSNIKPKTCGFYKCEYQFKGKKLEPGKKGEIIYDSKPKETNGNKFEYFNPSEDNEVTWLELYIFVLPKQKIKYQGN